MNIMKCNEMLDKVSVGCDSLPSQIDTENRELASNSVPHVRPSGILKTAGKQGLGVLKKCKRVKFSDVMVTKPKGGYLNVGDNVNKFLNEGNGTTNEKNEPKQRDVSMKVSVNENSTTVRKK